MQFQPRDYAQLSKTVYNWNDLRDNPIPKGWTIDLDLSSKNHATFVNKKTGRAVVAFSGTRIDKSDARSSDLSADASIAVGAHAQHPRFHEAIAAVKAAQAKYGNDKVEATGHSLGGSLAMHASAKLGVPATVFNPGVSPFVTYDHNNYSHVIAYSNTSDPVSQATRHIKPGTGITNLPTPPEVKKVLPPPSTDRPNKDRGKPFWTTAGHGFRDFGQVMGTQILRHPGETATTVAGGMTVLGGGEVVGGAMAGLEGVDTIIGTIGGAEADAAADAGMEQAGANFGDDTWHIDMTGDNPDDITIDTTDPETPVPEEDAVAPEETNLDLGPRVNAEGKTGHQMLLDSYKKYRDIYQDLLQRVEDLKNLPKAKMQEQMALTMKQINKTRFGEMAKISGLLAVPLNIVEKFMDYIEEGIRKHKLDPVNYPDPMGVDDSSKQSGALPVSTRIKINNRNPVPPSALPIAGDTRINITRQNDAPVRSGVFPSFAPPSVTPSLLPADTRINITRHNAAPVRSGVVPSFAQPTVTPSLLPVVIPPRSGVRPSFAVPSVTPSLLPWDSNPDSGDIPAPTGIQPFPWMPKGSGSATTPANPSTNEYQGYASTYYAPQYDLTGGLSHTTSRHLLQNATHYRKRRNRKHHRGNSSVKA